MKRQGIVVTLVCALLITLPAICPAALITMTVTGQQQGLIKGGNTQKGQENTIAVLATSLEMLSPRDSASGLPTGRLMPGPVGITKKLDPATPALVQAFASNENLTSVVIRFYRKTSAGSIQHHFTITLANASLGAFASNGNGASGAVEEILALYWQTMEMKNEQSGGVTVVDWAPAP